METSEENKLYRQISLLYKDKTQWVENIPEIGKFISADSVRIQAKALWVLGEMGLLYSEQVSRYVPRIAAFLKSSDALLRERALNALGRIGRSNFSLIEPYFTELFAFAEDTEPSVRLSFIWASENIATNTPAVYKDHMETFAKLLHDPDSRVRIEAPEIFRVLGKRVSEYVTPYLDILTELSEHDTEPVVRIHALGAVKATMKGNIKC